MGGIINSNDQILDQDDNRETSSLENLDAIKANNEPNDVATVRSDDDDEDTEKCHSIVSELTDTEMDMMTDPNMPLRYLRAEKGNVETATKRLKETLAWQE